jgi:hypothetical protein
MMNLRRVAMPKRELVIDRDDANAAAWMAMCRAEDESLPDEERERAQALYDQLGDALLYQDSGIHLVPTAFGIEGYYDSTVDVVVRELNADRRRHGLPDVEVEYPAYVRLARVAAALTDTQEYSVDYRLDALSCLDGIVASLKRFATDYEEADDDWRALHLA